MHTHNDKLAIYLPQADEDLYNSLVEGSASDHAVDTAGSDLVVDLVRFGFRVRFDGVERVLGAPYSLDPEFMVSHVKQVVDKTIRLADSIKLMHRARAEFLLLRYCTFSRIMHLLRLLPSAVSRDFLLTLEPAIRCAFEHIVGSAVSDDVWARAKLPIRLSGCGLSDPAICADVAYLSSSNLVAKTLHRESIGNSDPAKGPLTPPNALSAHMLDLLESSNDVDDARSRIGIAGSKLGAINLTCPPLGQLHAVTWPSQRQFTEIAYRPVLVELIGNAGKTSRPLEAWIRSCCCFGAYNWLMAIPGIQYFECASSVYAVTLRHWLGMPNMSVSLHETPVCAAKEYFWW